MSITNFDDQTHNLTENELKAAERIKYGISFKMGKDSAITNKSIRAAMKKEGYNISDVRMRAIIHYIRVFYFPDLIATSKGYYRTTDINELKQYADSLTERVEAIQTIIKQINFQIKTLQNGRN